MDYSKIVQLLEPICSEKDILKVFQFGSRVWGTASANADWDFFVVIDNYSGKVHPDLNLELVGCQVDISAYNVAQWKSLLFEHDMLALVCEFLPLQFRWKDAYDSEVIVSLKTLVRGISKEVQKCLSMTKVHWKLGDKRTSVKNFVHATRYISFATQISSYGEIQDLGTSNERLKDAMERLKDQTATYYTYSAFYKPQILSLLSEFQNSVQQMIIDELDFVNTIESLKFSPHDALISYLNSRGLSNLRRFFCITISLQSQADHFIRYILSSTTDSPPCHPFSCALGCTLVEFDSAASKFSLLAWPRSFVEARSLDSPSLLSDDLKRMGPPYFAADVHVDDCEMVQFYDQRNNCWSTFCTTSRPEMVSIELTFRSKLAALGLDHPEEERICATWLFNTQTSGIRLVWMGGLESTLVRDLMSGAQFGSWPKFSLVAFKTEEAIRQHLSELEAMPLVSSGLYFPGGSNFLKIESRTRLALDWVNHSIEEDVENSANQQLSRQYCLLALSLARDKSILSEIPSSALTTVENELTTYHSVAKTVTFFWSLVKAEAESAIEFTKRMEALKLWNPVISVMRAIQLHYSRDPLIILFTSPIKVYQHWKAVFDPAKISKLVDFVSNPISTSSEASSSS